MAAAAAAALLASRQQPAATCSSLLDGVESEMFQTVSCVSLFSLA